MRFFVRQRNVDAVGIAALELAVIRGKAGQGGGPYQLIEYGGVRLHKEFGGGHFLTAEGIPEAQLCAQQEIEAVDGRKGQGLLTGKLVVRRDGDKELSRIKGLAPSRGKGRMAMSQVPSFQADRTSAFWQMAEATIFSGWAVFSCRSSTHKGAGHRTLPRWSAAAGQRPAPAPRPVLLPSEASGRVLRPAALFHSG